MVWVLRMAVVMFAQSALGDRKEAVNRQCALLGRDEASPSPPKMPDSLEESKSDQQLVGDGDTDQFGYPITQYDEEDWDPDSINNRDNKMEVSSSTCTSSSVSPTKCNFQNLFTAAPDARATDLFTVIEDQEDSMEAFSNVETINKLMKQYNAYTLNVGGILHHDTDSESKWWENGPPQSDKQGGVWFSSTGGSIASVKDSTHLKYKVTSAVKLLFIPRFASLKDKYVKGYEAWEAMRGAGAFGYFSCDECEIVLNNTLCKKNIERVVT